MKQRNAETVRAKARTFLGRLARDTRGNTLALVGAAFIPLVAMVGSGVDMSRAYMAKTRLQSACDSAALAGRRILVDDSYTDDPEHPVRMEAVKFFSFNFPDGIYGTTPVDVDVTKPDTGIIRVAANTTIPTSVMHLFGYEEMALSVECQASQNFVSTDIMLVLDVTGSMEEEIPTGEPGPPCTPKKFKPCPPAPTVEKIDALKDAVKALYDELKPIQAQLAAAGLRLRYGFVPYSSAVNVGKLVYAEEVADNAPLTAADGAYVHYIAKAWPYQSRRMGTETVRDWWGNPITSSSTCRDYGGTWSSGTCTRSAYVYEQRSLDTSVFKTGIATTDPTKTSGTSTWNGCIEERQTDNTIDDNATGLSVPDTAYDLDIDMMPDNAIAGSAWGPQWPSVIYSRSGGQPSSYCPREAKRLQVWTETDFDAYVNSLAAVGSTYHDIGMIWGARFISDGGIFGEDNPTTYGEMPVNKHIIFMTDGQLAPSSGIYAAYGYETLDRRVTGTTGPGSNDGELKDRHLQRFRMICDAAKQKDLSIWVIAFATSASSTLKECASSSSQVSEMQSQEALIAKFVEIGKNIGALRLTQ